jgi:hypothetical protein
MVLQTCYTSSRTEEAETHVVLIGGENFGDGAFDSLPVWVAGLSSVRWFVLVRKKILHAGQCTPACESTRTPI